MSAIQSYFKRLKPTNTEPEAQSEQLSNSISIPTVQESSQPPPASQFQLPPQAKVNIENLEADPRKRPSIYSMTSNPIEREDIRRAYLLKGPTQPILKPFPQTDVYGKMRRFNPKWYEEFGSWLEYSVSKDACFCLYYYLFDMEAGGSGSTQEACIVFDELADIPFLSSSLDNFIVDVRADFDFVNLQTISDLALKMVEKRKDIVYPLVYLLIKLALILPIATASVERVFLAMTFVKNKLRNRISDDWFNSCMLTFVERDIFDTIDNEDIIQYFQGMKNRRMIL